MPNSCKDISTISVLLRLPGREAMRYECRQLAENERADKYILLSEFNSKPTRYEILRTASQPLDTVGESKPQEVIDEISRKKYCLRLSKLISSLKKEGGKTVICRRLHSCTTLSVDEIFSRLCQTYPSAAVYAWQNADIWWIGATPELLVNAENGRLTTMSLAGSRPVSKQREAAWDSKNVEEQEMVTRFIIDELSAAGLTPQASEPQTCKAGPVEHLCSMVSASASLQSTLSVAERLAPTPAVAGYPRARALEHIADVEDFPREYYAGYFGLVDADNADLYVTLRCMKLSPSGRLTIYAGGGITHASIPEKEWEETCIKASTLLSVIN